jgi:hypothetical protein
MSKLKTPVHDVRERGVLQQLRFLDQPTSLGTAESATSETLVFSVSNLPASNGTRHFTFGDRSPANSRSGLRRRKPSLIDGSPVR